MTESDSPSESFDFEIAKDGITSLVVGYDGTAASRDALAYSAGIARRNTAGVVVVFVREHGTPASGFSASSATIAATTGAASDTRAASLRLEVDAELAPLGVIYEFAEVEGEPARAIERLAAAGGADAIVVGRSRSPHALLGSVAGRLVRNANRPVIVVP